MNAPPGLVGSTLADARLTAKRVLRGRKLRVAAVAAFVVVLFPAVVALLEDDAVAAEVVEGGIKWGFFRLLVFLLPILFASGVIGEEVEGRTLHFLAMRPVSRGAIALGKLLVAAAASLAVMWAALLLMHLVSFAASPTQMIEQLGDTARAGGAASLLIVTYCGICLFWGALVPEAGGMVSVIWLGFVELFLGLMPGAIRFASMNHFAKELAGIERGGFFAEIVPDVELWICGLVVAAVGLLFSFFGVLWVQLSELRFGKA